MNNKEQYITIDRRMLMCMKDTINGLVLQVKQLEELNLTLLRQLEVLSSQSIHL